MFPAAFGPWSATPASEVPWIAPADSSAQGAAPLVSVGALNPNGTTALFSNTGPWVRCYAPGASVVSTVPMTDGGAQPIARTVAAGRKRETIDPDDYSAGFAVWSGTSFAAPVIAGRIAAALHGVEPTSGGRAGRVARAVEAAGKVVAGAS
jgi:subtilisin family serine protease